MEVTIRAMKPPDTPEVVRGWNLSLIHNQTEEPHFERVILDDPNHEMGASLVAVHDDEIVGFVSSVTRKSVSGADGRGRPYEMNNGYIRGMFVLEDFRRRGIGTKLLDGVENYMRSKGKSVIKTGTYTGRYFFPGIDLRYEAALKFFAAKGFEHDHAINDVDLCLKNFEISDYQKDARRRMAEFGVHVEEYDPSMLPEMKKFVGKINMTTWFPEGWEKGFKERGNKFVALKNGEIVGWASYHPRIGTAGFGPIAVLEEMRGHGIGSCLLLECVLRMKEAGADWVIASWANTPFYLPNGWKICRQYSVLKKRIG